MITQLDQLVSRFESGRLNRRELVASLKGSMIEKVAFKSLRISGWLILDAASGHFDINEHTSNITSSP